ncbi:MAG TPA: alcohol dehydrogenase catalytic domain-containing protein, partial [Gammaproteobacteria bacterium]|nr:alcohol dehydrogenase catalytic domain-containing protein [Gammaproteobacteria bacterium]
MKMLALVLNAPRDLTLERVPVKEPSADEILIRVKACGVCGTDLHLFEGTGGAMDSEYPLIMGHEFAGEIVRCGDAVTDLKSGDHVAVDPNVYCGKCEPCRSGEVHFCQNMVGIGTTAPGAFAEYCTVPSRSAYKVDPSLSLDVAAMMEPVGCCLHGVDRANIQPGCTTVIIGFGPAGQIIAQLALLSGSARLIVIEPVAEKRAMARAIGATTVIDPLH